MISCDGSGRDSPVTGKRAGQLALGYRRRHKDAAGHWLVRSYLGGEHYAITPLGTADDFGPAGMTHAEAQRAIGGVRNGKSIQTCPTRT